MTDKDLVAKKLALVETSVRELNDARVDAIPKDVREQRFVERTLQIAIQGMLDVASHIVSDDRLGEPETNAELMEALCNHGWLSEERLPVLYKMVGFRNVLVHGYDKVRVDILIDIVSHHLDDVLGFVTEIRSHLKNQ